MTGVTARLTRLVRRAACALFLVVLTVSAMAQVSPAGKRYALVVGNGNYSDLPDLASPAGDAASLARVLESVGFSVETLVDTDLPTMEDALVRFGARLGTDRKSVV